MLSKWTVVKLFLLSFIVFSGRAYADSLFAIEPYTIKNDQGGHWLKFKLKNTKNLTLENVIHGHARRVVKRGSKDYRSGTLHSVNLGVQECDTFQSIYLIDKDLGKIIYESSIHYYPCDPNEPINFGLISDTQQDQGRHKMIADLLAVEIPRRRLNFVINAGDIVHEGGIEEEWLTYLKVGNPYLSQAPLIPVLGNHEFNEDKTRPSPVNFSKYMRWQDADKLNYYSVDFPQFKLVIFNSNYVRLKPRQWLKQWKWLKGQVNEAYKQGKNVVFTMHHSPITSASSFLAPHVIAIRSGLYRLQKKYGNIKLVLTGHTHLYERSLRKGVHYVVAGPAGGRKGTQLLNNRYRQFIDKEATTFSLFSVSQDRIKMKTYNENGRLIDRFVD